MARLELSSEHARYAKTSKKIDLNKMSVGGTDGTLAPWRIDHDLDL